jgi:homogentisate 1,2-dioxygenase
MLDRVACGDLPPKHHVALRSPGGRLRYEECLTRSGFEGAYTILYRENRPQSLSPAPTGHAGMVLRSMDEAHEPDMPHALLRRHYRTRGSPPTETAMDSRVPLLFSDDIVVSTLKPSVSDGAYFSNGDADELFFVRAGNGIVRSALGDLAFSSGDYVCIPKGIAYRFVVDSGDLDMLLVECQGLGIPRHFRNDLGQLRMDAPYGHRDFRRPLFRGPLDEGFRELVVKRHGVHHGFKYEHSPLDVVGWDGAVYPWAFPILSFQPRVSAVHLPPTVHGTFAARGVLVSSFVPRPLDFHPDAVPCPYPHSSVDVDEVIYYVSGEFSSRTGVGVGSITLHPAGLPHGPHPGRYESSPGTRRTDEVAVMLDCDATLRPTAQARNLEDLAYDASFRE